MANTLKSRAELIEMGGCAFVYSPGRTSRYRLGEPAFKAALAAIEAAGCLILPNELTKEMVDLANQRKWAHRSIKNTYADIKAASPYVEKAD